MSVLQVCRDLKRVANAMRRWLSQYDAERGGEPGQALTGEPRKAGA